MGLVSVITAIFGAIAVKMIAAILGPSGTGLFGLLRQTQTTAVLIGSLSGQQALTQAIASRDSEERQRYVKTIFAIFALGAFLMTILIFIFADYIGHEVLRGSGDMQPGEIRWLCLPVVFGIFMAFFTALAAGNTALNGLILIQVMSTLGLMIAAYPMSQFSRSNSPVGLIHLLSVSSGFGAISGAVYAKKKKLFCMGNLIKRRGFDFDCMKHFLRVSLTMVATTLVNNSVLIIIRCSFATQQGRLEAGYFDAAWTISTMYLTFALNTFNAYFFPKLSSARNSDELEPLVNQLMRMVLIGMTLLLMPVIAVRSQLLNLLYSSEYEPTISIMRWMVPGDFMKSVTWIFGITLLARTNMKWFLFIELFFNGVLFILSLPSSRGLIPFEFFGLAYFLTSTLSFCVLFYHATRVERITIYKRNIRSFGINLVGILTLTCFFWNIPRSSVPMILGSVLVTLFFIIINFDRRDRGKIFDFTRSRLSQLKEKYSNQ
jgi:O-antigen/teichoic acid export membrane protein